jgi:acetylornithine deacetylase
VISLPSTTDARFFLKAGVPALCYGPRTRNIHGVDEAVELQSIVDAARTIARFMTDFLGAGVAA